jgi:hypothetical protein
VEQNRGWAAAASFGTSNSGENNTNGGANISPYLQLIPSAGTGANPFRLTSHASGTDNERSIDTTTAPVGQLLHVIGVYDQSAGQPGTFRFYRNGTLIASSSIANAGNNLNLATFTNNNNWLGRSQWNDPAFDGTYDEFAIYNHPLSQSEVTAIYQAGPVPLPAPDPDPPAAENRPNRYVPHPQVSNLTTGMAWPQGQALPTFALPAPTLDTILVQDLTQDEQLTFSALQGQVNKTRPRVYLLDSGADEGTYTWANSDVVGFSSRTLYNNASRYNLVAKYAGEVAGVVLYDPAISVHYRNLACTVAGLRNAIPVTPTVRTAMVAAGINLPVVVDLTTLSMTAGRDIYNYLYDTYWHECNRRVIVSANPASDFHHTRDIAAATGGAVLWLSTTSTTERNIYRKFFGDMTAGEAIVLGWYTTERSGVTLATSFGISTIPADHYISATVYGGTDHRIRVPKVPAKPPLENKVYISIFLSDGDKAQYMQRAMRKFWNDYTPSRGIVPLNWTVAPGLVDMGPALLIHYYTTATTKDCFVAGPSGMGYLMPVNTLTESGAVSGTHLFEQAAMDGYAKLTETYMQRAGLRVLTVWDNATDMHRASYENKVRNLYGATVQRFSGSSSVVASIENERIRFDRLLEAYAGSYASLRDSMNAQLTAWNGTAPLFLSYQVNIWGEMKPNRIVDLHNELQTLHPGKFAFCRADHYFNLFNEANNLPFNLSMSAQTAVTASGGHTPSAASDGSPFTLWTSSATGPRSLNFDLGGLYNLHRYVIRHAGDAGLNPALNTRDYRVQVSADGNLWTTVDTYIGNKANVTDIEFPLVTARHVRILIDHPGHSTTARIADVELFGRNPLEIILPDPDPSFLAWMEALPVDEKPPAGQRGPLDEPAGDGMSNLLKYAFGLKPLTSSAEAGPRIVSSSDETLTIEITRSKTSTATIHPDCSTTLETWQPADFTTIWQENLADDRERIHYLIEKPTDEGCFVRLRIELDE